MINYFGYGYPQPEKGPFSLTLGSGPCPWQPKELSDTLFTLAGDAKIQVGFKPARVARER